MAVAVNETFAVDDRRSWDELLLHTLWWMAPISTAGYTEMIYSVQGRQFNYDGYVRKVIWKKKKEKKRKANLH